MDLISYLLDNSEKGLDENTLKDNAWDHFGVEVAALVIDSVGFTRTTKTKGIVYFLTQLAKSRKITNQVMDKHKPISYSFHADNCYAFFRDVDLAFNAAIELQKMIKKASIPLGDIAAQNLKMNKGEKSEKAIKKHAAEWIKANQSTFDSWIK